MRWLSQEYEIVYEYLESSLTGKYFLFQTEFDNTFDLL